LQFDYNYNLRFFVKTVSLNDTRKKHT
jgi:hypothetical protein